MSALTSPAKRRGWYWLLDQVVSSLSNGLILFAVAVVSTAEDFGLIPLLLMLLTAGVGCMCGALGTPLLLKAADGIDHIRRGGSYAATAALAVSPLLVGGMWLLLKGRELGTPTILIAIATPLVMVQDVLRYVVISEGRPHVAAIWDGFWFLGSVGLLVSTWAGTRFVDANVLIAGWTVLAAAALLGLAINLHLLPGFAASSDGWPRAGSTDFVTASMPGWSRAGSSSPWHLLRSLSVHWPLPHSEVPWRSWHLWRS